MKCSKCGRDGEPGVFATFRNKKGEIRRRGICKTCRGLRALENFEYLQQWRKKNNERTKTKRQIDQKQKRAEAKAFVDEIKAKTPCKDCGGFFPPVAMDFDHGDNPKYKNVAVLCSSGYRLPLIKEEISKCELVCACCHRVRTYNRKQFDTAPRKVELEEDYLKQT